MKPLAIITAALSAALVLAQSPQNLLANPGFEDPAGWSQGWTIENTAGNASPYVYHLTSIGGGHGKARPRSGDNAIEIYSSDRVTRLSQQVTLEPGTYRLAAWVRNNGASIDPKLQLLLGSQSLTVPTLSDRYRQYFADFAVKQAGPQLVGFISKTLGLALDDVSLTKLAGGEPVPPYLFFDLSPTSEERSAGVQTYLRGYKQWVNFTISTTDHPVGAFATGVVLHDRHWIVLGEVDDAIDAELQRPLERLVAPAHHELRALTNGRAGGGPLPPARSTCDWRLPHQGGGGWGSGGTVTVTGSGFQVLPALNGVAVP